MLTRCTVALVLCAPVLTVGAQTMYKCQNNGKIEYSDRPCRSGAEVKRLAPDGGPTREDRERARMRVAAEQARFAAQERQAVPAPGIVTQGGAAASPSPTSDPDNEKVLTHDSSGWDRKPRGQIAAEDAAREQGRERARASAAGAGNVPKAAQGTWGSEKVLTHSQSGWNYSTRSSAVQAEADRAYRNEKARLSAPSVPNLGATGPSLITSCDSGGCWDTGGQRYNGTGLTLFRTDGKVCQKVGTTLNCN